MRLYLCTADWVLLTRRLKCSSFFCREPPWNLPEGFAVPFDFQTSSRGFLNRLYSYSLLVHDIDHEISLSCFGSSLLWELPAPGGTAVRAVSSWYLRLQCALADRHEAYPPPARLGLVERGKQKRNNLRMRRAKRKGRKRINQTRESGLRKMRKSTLGVAGGTWNTRTSTM